MRLLNNYMLNMECLTTFDVFSDTGEDVEVINRKSFQGFAEDFNLLNERKSLVYDNVLYILCNTVASYPIKSVKNDLTRQSFSNFSEMDNYFLFFHAMDSTTNYEKCQEKKENNLRKFMDLRCTMTD